MRRSNLMVLALAVLTAAFWANVTMAKDELKTVTGKSACATCEGVTKDGHNIMLVDKDGMRWILIGDSESYKAAHKVRDEGKKMTATLTSEPIVKKGENGKEYKEVKVSDVKIEA